MLNALEFIKILIQKVEGGALPLSIYFIQGSTIFISIFLMLNLIYSQQCIQNPLSFAKTFYALALILFIYNKGSQKQKDMYLNQEIRYEISISALSTNVNSSFQQQMKENRSRADRPALNQLSMRKHALLAKMNQLNEFLNELIDRFQYQQCSVMEKIGIYSDVIESQYQILLKVDQLDQLVAISQQSQNNNQVTRLMRRINMNVIRFWRSLKIQQGYRNNQREGGRLGREDNPHQAIISEKSREKNRDLGVNQKEKGNLYRLRSQEKLLPNNKNIIKRQTKLIESPQNPFKQILQDFKVLYSDVTLLKHQTGFELMNTGVRQIESIRQKLMQNYQEKRERYRHIKNPNYYEHTDFDANFLKIEQQNERVKNVLRLIQINIEYRKPKSPREQKRY